MRSSLHLARPRPPASLLDVDDLEHPCAPAHDLAAWITATFLDDASLLFNEEHIHLRFAHIGVLWCAVPNKRQMMTVAAQAEMPRMMGNAWAKARHDQQLRGWFGAVPDFLLTFDPAYAASISDVGFCALVEHELHHCGQNKDSFGAPKFKMDGSPSFGIKGHDVEEFVSVVRRYGARAGAGRTAELVEAANAGATIADVDVARVCGTCGS